MAIKWKGKILLGVSVFALVGGSLFVERGIHQYIDLQQNKMELENQVDRGISDILLEEIIKDGASISQKEPSSSMVERYKYYFGSLDSQLGDIRAQYSKQLDKAVGQPKEKEKIETEIRTKQEAIIENFVSDDAVKDKLMTEQHEFFEKANEYELKEVEKESQFFKDNYQYVIKTGSGKQLTNVSGINLASTEKEIKAAVLGNGSGEIKTDERTYELDFAPFLKESNLNLIYFTDVEYPSAKTVIVPKRMSKVSAAYRYIEKTTKKIKGFMSIGVASLILGLISMVYWFIRYPIGQGSRIESWPLDILGVCILIGTFAITLVSYGFSSWYYLSLGTKQQVIAIIILTGIILLSALIVILGNNFFLRIITERSKLKLDWQRMWSVRLYHEGKQYFHRLPLWMRISLSIIIYPILFMNRYRFDYVGYYGIESLFISVGLIIWFIWATWSNIRNIYQTIQLFSRQKSLLKQLDVSVQENRGIRGELDNFDLLEKTLLDAKKQESQANSLQTELLTNVSHDLRTPLTSIISYGDLLSQEKTLTSEQSQYVGIINQKAQRMKSLIDDVFTVSKMNYGEVSLDKEIIAIDQLMQQIVSEYSEDFKEKKLAILYKKPEEPVIGMVDGAKMWRVFDNILVNALKYSLPNTRVYVKVSQNEEKGCIEIKNIASYQLNEDAEKLIEKFQRGDESRHTEGTGLGLAIVDSIVHLHGGDLEIQVDGDMFKLSICLPLEV